MARALGPKLLLIHAEEAQKVKKGHGLHPDIPAAGQ